MDLKIEELLPIGSVVSLRGSEKKIMVIGFYVAVKESEDNKIYDYLGCMWPEGVVDSDKNIVFNAEDIVKIITKGVENEEEKEYKTKLAEFLKTVGKKDTDDEAPVPDSFEAL